MCEHNRAVRKSIPKPVAMDMDDADNVPGVAPISGDGSVDSLLFSHASESEGDIWGNNNYDDDASNAPEGAHRRTRGKVKEYPPAVWRRGADGNNMFALTFGQQETPHLR